MHSAPHAACRMPHAACRTFWQEWARLDEAAGRPAESVRGELAELLCAGVHSKPSPDPSPSPKPNPGPSHDPDPDPEQVQLCGETFVPLCFKANHKVRG